jgi:nucleotide-binding universal stress UspA family protein
MKKILIPTDFTECANYATQYAFEIAKKLNCELEFLHVISTPVDWVKVPFENEKLFPEILEHIRIAKNELSVLESKSKDKNIKAKSSLVFNVGSENIASYINESEYELITIGSHGSSGIKEKLIGSNTQKVIRSSSIPVLVVKKKPEKSFTNAVFISDFEDISKQAFHKLTALADKINMRTQLLYVDTHSSIDTDKTQSKMDKLLSFCDRDEKCSKQIISAETIEKGVQHYSKKENIDMVCICTHGKSGLKQLFSPSIAESIANHLELPLLSIKL